MVICAVSPCLSGMVYTFSKTDIVHIYIGQLKVNSHNSGMNAAVSSIYLLSLCIMSPLARSYLLTI